MRDALPLAGAVTRCLVYGLLAIGVLLVADAVLEAWVRRRR